MSLKLTWAAAVVGAFIAVGCGKKEEAPAPAPAPAPAAEAPAAASAPAPAPAAAAGGETQVVKIGHVAPVSGPQECA